MGEKPILDWLIGDAERSGLIDEYIVISNHRFAEQFRIWAAGKPERISILDDGTESNETRLGAVRDLQMAAERMDPREDALVLAGDNVLEFSLAPFIRFGRESGCGCVMCYEEPELERQRRTAIIQTAADGTILDYEEKPREPKTNLAVPPFYYYRAQDLRRIDEALAAGCGYDAPGSFAVWLSGMTDMHAWMMPGGRYDIGDMRSYEAVKEIYHGPTV